MPQTQQPESAANQKADTNAPLPARPIHPKLVAAGITQEDLDSMGTGAILCQTCPDCNGDIMCTLTNEYYESWKKHEPVALILDCSGCRGYKFNLKAEDGELLYEKEGPIETRDSVPMVEVIRALPGQGRKREEK